MTVSNPPKQSTRTRKRTVKVKVPTLSRVRPPRADLDVGNIKLTNGKDLSARLRNAITDGEVDTTIEGASTLTLTISDWHEGLLHSQLLKEATTLVFDGESFTLTKMSRAEGGSMTLTLEDTAVAVLRKYKKPKKANRASTTRAQFIRSMVTEAAREARIPFRCPEVDDKQPIAGQTKKK